MNKGGWTVADQHEVSAGLLWNTFLQNHRIPEYSELEGTHKDQNPTLTWIAHTGIEPFGIISAMLQPAELQVIWSHSSGKNMPFYWFTL